MNNWPRLVQIAWILHDQNGATIAQECFIIKPDGLTRPADASRIHGITTENAKKGVDVLGVLNDFHSHVESSQYLIAHNINFDKNIVGAEFLRAKMKNPVPNNKLICTMRGSVNYCALNGPYGYKYPKLIELHRKLFNCSFDGAHGTSADITATSKCFWEMRKRGLI